MKNGTSDSISSSNASGNAIYGIDIAAQNTTVTSSLAIGNDVGVEDTGVGNNFKSVNTSGNRTQGFDVYTPASQTTITSSTANSNGWDGINVRAGTVSITSSTADGNRLIGIEVSTDSATLKGNTADTNGYDLDYHPPFDFFGLGIQVSGLNPTGKNTAHGNDNDSECDPSYLC
jgi:hypothetical protein